VAGAHALNFSRPQQLADLIGAFLRDEPLEDVCRRHPGMSILRVPDDGPQQAMSSPAPPS